MLPMGNMSAPLLDMSLYSGVVCHHLCLCLHYRPGHGQRFDPGSQWRSNSRSAIERRKVRLSEHEKVRVAKITSVFVGIIAIGYGIWWEKLNVGFLVGWAFSVAASANLPALVYVALLETTTRQGVIASVGGGHGWFARLDLVISRYLREKLRLVTGWPLGCPFSQPASSPIPLAFAVWWPRYAYDRQNRLSNVMSIWTASLGKQGSHVARRWTHQLTLPPLGSGWLRKLRDAKSPKLPSGAVQLISVND